MHTPIAPPGAIILIHQNTIQRKSWEPHAIEGYYIGPAMEHYRCYNTYCMKTGATRILDTIEFITMTPVDRQLQKRTLFQ